MSLNIKNAQDAITRFMIATGQATPGRPTASTKQVQELRMELIREEWTELVEALGYETINGTPIKIDDSKEPNLVAIADALADLTYVVLGAATAFGIDLEPIFEEVHKSNMTKLIDGAFRADGKYVKGPSYTPANLTPIIQAQLDAH